MVNIYLVKTWLCLEILKIMILWYKKKTEMTYQITKNNCWCHEIPLSLTRTLMICKWSMYLYTWCMNVTQMSLLHQRFKCKIICLLYIVIFIVCCRAEDTKIVMTMRNLKDTFVSYYHHLNGMTSKKKTWAEYFHYFLHRKISASK